MSSENEQDDIATQKINELRQRAREDFSEEEINKFITMGKQLAGKAVLGAIIKLVEEGPVKGFSAQTAKQLIKRIEARAPYNYAGYVQCAFAEIPYLLNVSLSVVPRDYKTDIDIPHASYAQDLFSKYDFLKNTAIAYWRQFAGEHKELYRDLCDYRADIDFSELVVDENNPTTLYFSAESSHRIGIFCYYVDRYGKPFYKNPALREK